MPKTAKVSWTTEDGAVHEAEANVPKLPKHDESRETTFCFLILPDETLKLAAFSHEEIMSHKDLELARNGGPAYVIGTKNATTGDLQGVDVKFGPYAVNGSQFVESGGANAGWAFAHGLPYPVTDTAQVKWTSADGTKHQKDFDLKAVLPPNLDGVCICFIIGNGDEVDVETRPWSEWRAWRR